MKKMLAGLFLIFGLIATSVASAEDKGVITLTATNHAALTGEVDNESITEVIFNLNKLSAETIYLFIDSPGGSVMAGNKLIQYLITTDKKIVCVAQTAISMAHQILQHCPKRVGAPDNILMQHRMTAGVNGTVDEMSGLLNAMKEMEIQLNKISAKRIGVSLDEFFKKVNAQWWTYGKQSKEQNMIDSISHIKCSSDLYSKDTSKTIVVFGIFRIPVLVNGCPLVPPRMDNSKVKDLKESEQLKLQELLVTQRVTPVSKI